ncbi:hypothetical protein VTK26DRAFT_5768 [Humicola hyalothermophila]
MWPMTRAIYPGLDDEAPPDRPGTADSYKTWYGNRRKSYASTHAGLGHQFSVRSRDTQIHDFADDHQPAGLSHQFSVRSTTTQGDLGELINRSQHVLSVLSEGGSVSSPTSPTSSGLTRQTSTGTATQDWPIPEDREWTPLGPGPNQYSHQYTVSAVSPSIATVPGDEAPWSRPSSGVYSTHSTITGLSGPIQSEQWGSNAASSVYSGAPQAPSVAETASAYGAPAGSSATASTYGAQAESSAATPTYGAPAGSAETASAYGASARSVAGSSHHVEVVQEPETYHEGGFPTAEGYSQLTQQTETFEQPYDSPDSQTLDPRPAHIATARRSVDISEVRSATRGTDTPISGMTVAAEPEGYPEKGAHGSESIHHHTRFIDEPMDAPLIRKSDGDGDPNPSGPGGDPEEEEEDKSMYLTGLPLVAVTVALSAAVFLVAMDVNVIATAIPRITGEFRSLDDIGWYGSAFLMATCATQIPFGRIYTIFPAKWVFIIAILIFMGGSLTAALSPNSPVLIFGRAVQGVGTSGILSGGLIIMSQVVHLRLRPVLSGVIGAMEGVAMISAPIIGGVLTDRLHWRWCFWINLPIGGFVLLTVLVCLRMPKKPKSEKIASMTWLQTLRYLDLLGAFALVPPIVCTLLALHYAGNGYSWGDMSVVLLFVLAVVLFALFAYTQYVNADVAMIPFRVAKRRAVLSGFWYILCTSSALVVITYFLPLWYQTVKDTSAQQSGVGLIPMLVAVIVGVVVSGALVSIIGYYTPFALLGSVLMPVGLGLLTTIKPDTSRAILLIFPGIFGLGVGVGFQQPLIGVQAALPQSDIPVGTSIIVFGQTIGAAIIIAAGESLFQNRLVDNLEKYLGLTNVDTQHLLEDGPAGLSSLLSAEQLPQLLIAVSRSLTETFHLALVMAALSAVGSIFMEWRSVKKDENDKKKKKQEESEVEDGKEKCRVVRFETS